MRFGGLELLVIFAIILLIFGPKQLPKLTKSLKESIASFKESKETNNSEETTTNETKETT